jgi:hypothetical protein
MLELSRMVRRNSLLWYDSPRMAEGEPGERARTGGEMPLLYATNVRVRTNVHDISLVFTRSVPVGQGKEEVDRSVCTVSMSPALMRSLLTILQGHVQIYEKKFGVRLPNVVKIEDDEDAGSGDKS